MIQNSLTSRKHIETIFSGISPKVLELVALIETHNFGKACPESKSDFYDEIISFLTEYAGKDVSFPDSLLKNLRNKFVYAQDEYVRSKKAQLRFELIRKYLPREGRILDYGCGSGGLARHIENNCPNINMHSADVYDWRIQDTKHLEFYLMKDHTLPYGDDFFETTILMYALHHIPGKRVYDSLVEVKRVSKKIILVEETFDVYQKDVQFTTLSDFDRKFFLLNREEQLQFTMVRDWFRNTAVFGWRDMCMPFTFKRIPEWRVFFNLVELSDPNIHILGIGGDGDYARSAFNVVMEFKKE